MRVYVYYEDTDNSCHDPECCGGPSPSPHIKVFSSMDRALKSGAKKEELTVVKVDTNELVRLITL